MSYFFTNSARQKMFTTPAVFSGGTISITFYREAPTFENNDARYVTAVTLADLEENLGWVQADADPVTFTTATTKEIEANLYVRYGRVPFTALSAPVEAKAMAFTLAGEIIFVTTSPFLKTALISPQDGLTSNPDAGTDFEVPPPESNNRWLFAWAEAPSSSLTLPGTTGNYLSTPDATALDITSEMTVIARIKPTDWTPASQVNIVSKALTTTNISWYFQLTPTGQLQFTWSSGGTSATNTNKLSGGNLAALVNNTWLYVSVTFVGATGSVRFWTSPDNVAWTELGTTTAVGATSIFSGAAPLEIGSASGGLLPFAGGIGYVQIRNTTAAGGEVFRFDLANLNGLAPAATTFTATTGQTVTINKTGSSYITSGPTTVASVFEGPLAISQGAPPFEASHTQHVWLYPQRTNFIANPSFEGAAVATGYWGSTGTAARVSLPTPTAVTGAWAGKFSRALGTISFHTGSSFIWTLDSPELDIPSDLCVVAKVTLDDWTPAVSNTIVSKHNSIDGQRSWALVVNSSGFLSLLWSSTGSGTNNVISSTSLGMTDGGTTWVGLSIKCSESGSMWARFWKSPDGVDWTLVNTASTSPIAGFFNTAAPLAIGGHTTGVQPLRGTVHHVSVRSGIGPGVNGGTIGGTEVFRYEGTPLGTASASGTTFPASTGQTMTIYGPDAVVTDAPPLVVESNVFPTYRAEHWTVQLRARGDGNLKVGFVWWDDDFTSTAVDWGVETWTLSSGSFTHIAICRTAVETYQGMLRLECDGTEILIDQVLVERGFLKDWDYFDGDSRYGERDDYSWYGGETRKGKSYSMWYNNYKAVHGRMFARETDDLSKITDEDLEQYGYVYKWIPSGTIVIPHSGVLHEGDTVAEVIYKDPTSVLSYKADDTDVMGIDNPWT